MTAKLTPVGGYALVIDKEILDRLRISSVTELDVFDNGTWILIDILDGRRRLAPAPPATTKLTAIGDGYGVVIDAKLLERLKISAETELDVSTDGQCIIVKPIAKAIEREMPFPGWDPLRPRPKPRRPEPKVRLPKKQPW